MRMHSVVENSKYKYSCTIEFSVNIYRSNVSAVTQVSEWEVESGST